MSEDTSATARQPDRSALIRQAIRLFSHPPTSRKLSSELLALIGDRDLADAIARVEARMTPADRDVIAVWRREDELEWERIHFVDPNRPGE